MLIQISTEDTVQAFLISAFGECNKNLMESIVYILKSRKTHKSKVFLKQHELSFGNNYKYYKKVIKLMMDRLREE